MDKLILENGLTGKKVIEKAIPEFMQGADPKIVDAVATLLSAGWTCVAPGFEQKEQKPIFRVGDAMRTLNEAAKGIKEGLPYVVSIDSEYYNCNNEKIRIEDQGDYEFPPMNRKQPAEWSEEDEKKLNGITTIVEEWWDNQSQKEKDYYGDQGYLSWLKSLRPQSKIEYINKQSLVTFIEDCIAENLESTTDENHDNHEGYHQACWDIIYRIKQMCK